MADKIIHLSDPHVKNKGNERVIASRDYIRERYPYHTVVVTGDITHNGRRSEYAAAASIFLGDIVCCGNHDFGELGNFDQLSKQEDFNAHFCVSYGYEPEERQINPTTVLIGLNTNPGTFGWWFDFARGKVGWFQRRNLKKVLKKYDDCTRIVYGHHHLTKRHLLMELGDAKKVIEILAGNCEVALMGHFHKDEMLDIPGIPLAHAAGAMFEATEALEITVKDGYIKHTMVPII